LLLDQVPEEATLNVDPLDVMGRARMLRKSDRNPSARHVNEHLDALL
jgi:hypothetical protein